MTRDLLSASDIGNDLETVTCLGNALQAQHLNRGSRRRLGNRLALVVEHRPHASKNLADDEWLMNVQGPLLNQHGSHSATAAIQFGFQHHARRLARGAGTQVKNV